MRFLASDAVQSDNSGHPCVPLGAARPEARGVETTVVGVRCAPGCSIAGGGPLSLDGGAEGVMMATCGAGVATDSAVDGAGVVATG